ncbi:MAG: DMT family transporter [Bdellovibrionaceae bacterium]|nr:DMT family transporter [Pseudobdellovibrionaceae bacterium]
MRTNTSLSGALQILAAGIGFGFLGIFGKLAFASGMAVGELLTWRFATAALLLGLVLALSRPNTLRLDRFQLLVCAGLGVFGYAVFSTLYFTAIEGVSVSLASLLLYTFPVLVTVGGRVFLREAVRPRQWLALPAAALGLMVLLWGKIEVRAWTAVASGLGSAACYAAYILASRRWQTRISPLTSGFYVIVFATLALVVFHRPDPSRLLTFGTSEFGAIIGLAVISTIGPMIFFLSGLQKMSATAASILSTVEPVTATVFSALIFGETIGWGHVLGGIGILSAVVLTVMGARPTRNQATDPLMESA